MSGRATYALVPLAAVAVTALAVLDGGGSGSRTLPLVGGIALGLAAAVAVAALAGLVAVPKIGITGGVALGAAAALAAWAGLSTFWTVSGEETWSWFGRLLAYLAFLVLGIAVGASRGGARRLAAGLGVITAVVLVLALAGVAIPSLHPDADRVSRLREPIGYWNALALIAAAALAPATWVAIGGGRTRRAAGVAFAYAATLSLLLTQSRAGLLAAVVAVAFVLTLERARVEAGLVLAVGGIPGALVAGWAFTRPALVEDGAGRAARVADAPLFATLALVGLAVALLAAWLLPLAGLAHRRARGLTHLLVALAGTAAVVGLLALTVSVGNPVRWAGQQVSGGECANDPSRLATLCANNRLAWWGDALDLAGERPVVGSGAGTFAIARLAVRDDATPVREPHSVPLQLLTDLGAIGLALAALIAGAVAVAARRAIRTAASQDRRLVVALATIPLVWATHALVDYDLDFIAVTAPALVAAGALIATGRPSRTIRSLSASRAGVVLAAAVLGLAVLVFPSLSEDAVDDVYRSLDRRDLPAAADAARLARRLDPIALGPLYAQAEVAAAAGDMRRARELLEEATARQPHDPETWLALGRFDLASDPPAWCTGYWALNEAYTLDPRSSRWVPGGPLDDARDAVNAGACEP